jgi:hypothetical protein
MMQGRSRPPLPVLLVISALFCTVFTTCNAFLWPACQLPASSAAARGQTLDKLSSLEVAAGELGCRLLFAPLAFAPGQAVLQLHSNAVITGEQCVASRNSSSSSGVSLTAGVLALASWQKSSKGKPYKLIPQQQHTACAACYLAVWSQSVVKWLILSTFYKSKFACHVYIIAYNQTSTLNCCVMQACRQRRVLHYS